MATLIAARLPPGVPYNDVMQVMRMHSIEFHVATKIDDLVVRMVETDWDGPPSYDENMNTEISAKEEMEEQDDDSRGRNLINSLLEEGQNETEVETPSTSRVTMMCPNAEAEQVKHEEQDEYVLTQNDAAPPPVEVKEEFDYQIDYGTTESGYSGAVDSQLQEHPGGSAQYGMESGYSGALDLQQDNPGGSAQYEMQANYSGAPNSLLTHRSTDLQQHERAGGSAQYGRETDFSGTARSLQGSAGGSAQGPTVDRFVDTVFSDKKFQCDVCTVSFNLSEELRVHSRRHFGEVPHSISQIIRPDPFTCIMCRKRFTDRNLMFAHLTTHPTPFYCFYCFVEFPTLLEFEQHARLHYEENQSKPPAKPAPPVVKKRVLTKTYRTVNSNSKKKGSTRPKYHTLPDITSSGFLQ